MISCVKTEAFISLLKVWGMARGTCFWRAQVAEGKHQGGSAHQIRFELESYRPSPLGSLLVIFQTIIFATSFGHQFTRSSEEQPLCSLDIWTPR